ncbi:MULTISPECIES: 2Fe-2S iron-sulfur cluster-binding protein [unclassified Polaromonas]|jgi:ferredoxin/truncated hemoglobin YjbI|uniref:2Fe-2S iron-sulfur cluster-binding protein n=1 Tax=unclassified Polaromonas TaxID=2638319 RepID=UPI000BCCA5C8|nr:MULTISPECIES: 2Fe-2S iron-sulfur cluster-binding protein [unclassified Polaromonas]OYY35275.1 MAG: hypothetical protein B7Y60_13195 [Polaromonas sp. 35-63-35]OYZ19119.1 MAG: hypothetical protein B7Y28_14080 [Polaromonas sp. 16-63-31]OYZ78218.1 MAG: hypothetical protein B7Y09_13860 [Polaromonas sp. 24-63-21]OZA48776.1 MAG: hypothetical protein B7X88_17720 [Polaromonas sp. 17-63-33]OZA87663.1 MAG: hypothetical protein B7X65_12285 [Polaromonas sp. 39-63-25]
MTEAVPVHIDGVELTLRANENLLDACQRSAIELPFSCRAGSCHTCLLRCTEGVVPAQAQRGLRPSLRSLGYLLACQCRPTGAMTLTRPSQADMVTSCQLLTSAGTDASFRFMQFETARLLTCQPGQRLLLVTDAEPAPLIEVTATCPETHMVDALMHCPPGGIFPSWLDAADAFGHEFEVRGPVDGAGDGLAGKADVPVESPAPAPDPALWTELDGGATVRAVLEDFYGQVYEDPLLAPFFQKVTRDRSIDKQYSFLKQLMTGERVYFGDRPRNAHHWMVISNELFDYRQALMVRTLEKHGLTALQIARWTRLELHYRRDIVKSAAWPRHVNGVDLPLDGYANETLSAGTLCDHCGAVIDAGTLVKYHVRLGHISCPGCASGGPQALASSHGACDAAA